MELTSAFGVTGMLRTGSSEGPQLEIVALEELVRQDHLLRKIKKHVDFGFIIEKVRPLYSLDNGRPSLDPIVLFKMLFIGYLFGIRSERRLVQEIADNVAYRWFLGIPLRAPVPSASVIWENRRRRWKDSALCQEIFNEIVRKAVEAGLVDGKVLYTDGTLIKANANRKKYMVKQVPESTRNYMKELDEAVNEDRVKHGKKHLRARREVAPKTREVKESITDPDSGYIVREGKPECFGYTEHRTVDSKHNIITDVHVTSAGVHDSIPYTERLARQIACFEFNVKAVGLDAGYLTA